MPHNYILPTSLVYTDYAIPVIMYDQVGCGASTAFPDRKGDAEFWTPELFMAELENVISHFGLAEGGRQYDLLGQSWGAMLAAQFVIERKPKGLRKLIIEGGPSDIPSYTKAGERLRAALPEDVREVLDRCERNGTTSSAEYQEAEMYYYNLHICRAAGKDGAPDPQELMDSFAQLEKDDAVYKTMMGENEFNATGTLKEWSIRDRVHELTEKTVPGGLLLMNGQYDTVQDETTDAFFYKARCRVKWVRFGLSSHIPILEETETFVKALGSFLTEE